MEKIKVSAVSYLNTLPFMHGLEKSTELANFMELSRDIPSVCAKKLIAKEVDLGLIPVAVIPQIENAQIISPYCIGATGAVHTVLLLSEVPLDQIESIYLDYQSKTSVQLCRLLSKNYWKIKAKFISAEPGYENKIAGKTAGVIIGDRTFNLPDRLCFRYDLSEAWHQWTGLPFVFAAWVANKKLDPSFIQNFSDALALGLQSINHILDDFENQSISKSVLKRYLEESIEYQLDSTKKEGLTLFLEKIKDEK